MEWSQAESVRLRRAPRGARGLKQKLEAAAVQAQASRPARGAWIETLRHAFATHALESRPARGAWIETQRLLHRRFHADVAPRAGRVD